MQANLIIWKKKWAKDIIYMEIFKKINNNG